jgi:hypothetical protein
MQQVITQGLPATVVAFILALIGCELGLLSITAAKAGHGRGRLGWTCLAALGIGVNGICAPQITALVAVSYFGSNCQVSGRAVAESIGVGVLTAFVAAAMLVAARGRVGGTLTAGAIFAAGAVAAHAVLLTGLVDPTIALRGVVLIESGLVACLIAMAALLLRSSRSVIGSGLAAVVLAAATATAERVDIGAVSIHAGAYTQQMLTVAQIQQLPTGVPSSELTAPLLIATCLSAIGLCFAGMQVGLSDAANQPSNAAG